jgi:uncharacterized protein YcfL
MKTHILFALITAFLLTACASHEGRKISSTEETREEQLEYSKLEGNKGRDFAR